MLCFATLCRALTGVLGDILVKAAMHQHETAPLCHSINADGDDNDDKNPWQQEINPKPRFQPIQRHNGDKKRLVGRRTAKDTTKKAQIRATEQCDGDNIVSK